MLIIGLDDTDVLGTRGTGYLARTIAGVLAETYPLLGVTRHQLLVHPQIPCTKNNSCAGILLDAPAADTQRVLERDVALTIPLGPRRPAVSGVADQDAAGEHPDRPEILHKGDRIAFSGDMQQAQREFQRKRGQYPGEISSQTEDYGGSR